MKKTTKKSSGKGPAGQSPSKAIDAKLQELGDWRGRALARIRALIRQADPEAVEEVKWRGVPVWSHDGHICTGEVYKSHVKLTFPKGASLDDPAHLFNASLEGKVWRAIDIHEGEVPDEKAFKALVRSAVALNSARATKSKPAAAKPKAAAGKGKRSSANKSKAPTRTSESVLLSGGNPQIAKGDGDAPVQAYIAAVPGWKRDVCRSLDALITRVIPDVRKAVKWNSPFYGVEGQGWFLSFHCFTKYVKVGFFRGSSLHPLPPGASKDKDMRYLDLRESEPIDEKQVASWIRQASKLPGWVT